MSCLEHLSISAPSIFSGSRVVVETEGALVIFVGIDWAEAHHDVCVVDEQGAMLAKARVPDGVEGTRRLHELVAEHAEEPHEVIVGIETDRGLLVGSLVAAGYAVFAIN